MLASALAKFPRRNNLLTGEKTIFFDIFLILRTGKVALSNEHN